MSGMNQRARINALTFRGAVALQADIRQGVSTLAAMQGPGLQIMLDTVADTLGAVMLAGGVLLTTLRQENRTAAKIALQAWRHDMEGAA